MHCKIQEYGQYNGVSINRESAIIFRFQVDREVHRQLVQKMKIEVAADSEKRFYIKNGQTHGYVKANNSQFVYVKTL